MNLKGTAMKRKTKINGTKTLAWAALRMGCLAAVMLLAANVLANSAPVVSNVRASQRGDESGLVDIFYDLADADGDMCTVWIAVSDNDGQSWSVPAWRLSGAIGDGIAPGLNRHIIWDAGGDLVGVSGTFRVRVFASDGYVEENVVLVPGGWFKYNGSTWTDVPGYYIDVFLVTNEQYALFLNEADPTSSRYTTGNQDIIRGGESGSYYYIVLPGREKYPVRWVSFNDANAYAAWKSQVTGKNYRLPNRYEWQKGRRLGSGSGKTLDVWFPARRD